MLSTKLYQSREKCWHAGEGHAGATLTSSVQLPSVLKGQQVSALRSEHTPQSVKQRRTHYATSRFHRQIQWTVCCVEQRLNSCLLLLKFQIIQHLRSAKALIQDLFELNGLFTQHLSAPCTVIYTLTNRGTMEKRIFRLNEPQQLAQTLPSPPLFSLPLQHHTLFPGGWSQAFVGLRADSQTDYRSARPL